MHYILNTWTDNPIPHRNYINIEGHITLLQCVLPTSLANYPEDQNFTLRHPMVELKIASYDPGFIDFLRYIWDYHAEIRGFSVRPHPGEVNANNPWFIEPIFGYDDAWAMLTCYSYDFSGQMPKINLTFYCNHYRQGTWVFGSERVPYVPPAKLRWQSCGF